VAMAIGNFWHLCRWRMAFTGRSARGISLVYPGQPAALLLRDARSM
jgi:hypothetical protein